MTTTMQPMPEPGAPVTADDEGSLEQKEVAGLSQGQIVRRRFLRHRAAMISLVVLVLVLLVAMSVGAAWAGVAGALKVTRGVSEVISTIMLNVIAGGLAAYLLAEQLQERVEGSNNSRTPLLPASARFPNLDGVLRAVGVEPP